MKKQSARNAEIVRRRLERQSVKQIAEAMKMTPYAVSRICERLGVRKPTRPRTRPTKPPKLSDVEMEAIRYRRERGESLSSLMECFEVGKLTIKRVIAEGPSA